MLRHRSLSIWQILRIVLLATLLLSFSPVTFASSPAVRSFTVADGLPDNMILDAVQDTEGYFWIATPAGLTEFFAASFTFENITDDLANMSTYKLLPSARGEVFAGGDGGVFVHKPLGSWEELKGGEHLSEVDALYQENDGKLWVGSAQGLSICSEGSCQQIEGLDLLPPVKDIQVDHLGQIWVASRSTTGAVIHVFKDQQVITKITEVNGLPHRAEIKAMLAESDKGMWIATDEGLAFVQDNQVTRVWTEGDGLLSPIVWSLLPSKDGGIWVGTTMGLHRLVNGQVVETFTSRDQLAGQGILSLLYDSEGNLWVGTESGLSRLVFSDWRAETDPILDFKKIKTVFVERTGRAFVILSEGIAMGNTDGDWDLLPNSEGIAFNCIAADSDGNIWVGGDQGLYLLRDGLLQRDNRMPTDILVSAIHFDRQEKLWVGTDHGLFQVVGSEVFNYDYDSGALGNDIVAAIWETQAGDLWVGTLSGGASRLRGEEWVIFSRGNSGLPNNYILDGLEDSRGNLWFATSNGLGRLDTGADPADLSSWKIFSTSASNPFTQPLAEREVLSPLIGEKVNVLLEDQFQPGLIWVGTNMGMSLINGNLVSSFSQADGLGSSTIYALAQSADRRLWVATPFGLVYHPQPGIAPLLRLQTWKVDNQVLDSTKSRDGVAFNAQVAELGYAGNDLADLDGVSYQITIQSQKNNESPVTKVVNTKDTKYSFNLEHSTTYFVTVQAFDREFNSSPTQSLPALVVNPPTLFEWLAAHPLVYLPIVLVMTGVAYAGVRFVRRKMLFAYPIKMEVYLSAGPEKGQVSSYIKAQRRMKTEEGKHIVSPDWKVINSFESQMRQTSGQDAELQKKLGLPLWQILTPDQFVPRLVDLGIGKSPTQIHLNIAAELTQLGRLPWEFIFAGPEIGHPLLTCPASLVRELGRESKPYTPPILKQSLKILFCSANPVSPRLSQLVYIEDEAKAIDEIVGNMRPSNQVDLISRSRVSWEQFSDAIQADVDIVHFTGHGGVYDGTSVLYFQDEDGGAEPIELDLLVRAFKHRMGIGKQGALLVVLNACRTADSDQTAGLLGLAEALVTQAGVIAAVGMGYPIPEDSGLVFSRTFYKNLLLHGQLDYAMLRGRIALANHRKESRDWGVPRLYTTYRLSQLFQWP